MPLYGTHFFWDSQRKNILAFGTLFQNIQVVRKNKDGTENSRVRVPLSYGPKEKWLHRLSQDLDFLNPLNIVLPRISYELKGYRYDSSRMSSATQTIIGNGNLTAGTAKKMYQAIPYNLNFSVYMMTKTLDEGLQIVEQILPFFSPDVTLTIDAISPIPQAIDVPIVLNNISHENSWDGGFDKLREITWNLDFTMKSYFFGPVRDSKIILDQLTSVNAGTFGLDVEPDMISHEGAEIVVDDAIDPSAVD